MDTIKKIIIIIFAFIQILSADFIPYQKNEIVVDGFLNDWKKYEISTFVDTIKNRCGVFINDLKSVYWEEADFDLISPPKSKNKVSVYYYWNKNYLNIAFKVMDKHLHANVPFYEKYPKIYLNDGIEFYIDTKNDSKNKMDINDYQFLVDIKGQSLVYRGDRKLMKQDTLAVPKDFGQNVMFKSAVNVLDSGYIVEMAIPFASIGIEAVENYSIKIDLCNNDLDHEIPSSAAYDDRYALAWSFNCNGQCDFGYPEYWRVIKLKGHPSILERTIDNYKGFWFFSLNISILLSLGIISFLILRMIKLQKMPKALEVHIEKTMTSEIETENQKLLNKAKQYILDMKNEPINSEELSKVLGISLRKFQRITREEMNCTPTNYIYIIKLSLAAEFINKGLGNVSQAAYEFGFSDPAYFSKLFKKHYGVSPKEFKTKI